ncbi:uncharacterized protein LOC120337494 [Styela clava]|uniref:small integral membrane protein 1-like n=1 Tax=Styela clava TaxID=7725 RepID=UPI001939FC22|nr:small integral membrane protein 1-like [Styela clava]
MPGNSYESWENGDATSTRSTSALDTVTSSGMKRWTTGTRGIILAVVVALVIFWVAFIIGYAVGYSIHKCAVQCDCVNATTPPTLF